MNKNKNKKNKENKLEKDNPDYYRDEEQVTLTDEELKSLVGEPNDKEPENKDLENKETPISEKNSHLKAIDIFADETSEKKDNNMEEKTESEVEVEVKSKKEDKKEIQTEETVKEKYYDTKLKSGGIMGKIHRMLSLNDKIDDAKNKIINRDPVAWHRILMAIIISYVGILLIVACTYDALTESKFKEYTEQLYLGQANGGFKIPEGEYKILGIKPTKADPKNPSNKILQERDQVILAAKDGGIVLYTHTPYEIELPKEFYDIDCFNLKIIKGSENEIEWEFEPTEHLDAMREEMKLRQEMFEKYFKEREQTANEAEQAPANNK